MTTAPLPERYAFLANEPGPRILVEALKLYGIREAAGNRNNPVILDWAKEVDLDHVYRSDGIAWCGLFMAVVAKRAGWDPVGDPLWARNWMHFGRAADTPSLGDILVFERQKIYGHVGVYVGHDSLAYHVLGGNQSNAVTVTRIARSRLLRNGARRPIWRHSQPANVRPVHIGAHGSLSNNEA